MSLIIASGSNIGDSQKHLEAARLELEKHFTLIASSRIYKSEAVDYADQPDFLNQVMEFALPDLSPQAVMDLLLNIEKKFGRSRDILRGPRTLDLDIIFWDMQTINTEHLTIPHPRWSERSFVVLPLRELPFFQTIEKCFTIPRSFKVNAFPI